MVGPAGSRRGGPRACQRGATAPDVRSQGPPWRVLWLLQTGEGGVICQALSLA
ncbi:hypothetical protein RC1_1478 [Rhodospirillum centenum SW]|uniref:Uncharacterized protein n=1 Tax=Rhodospirillum centenum (strain ATCC 51521 / SW) TaxID=414684 RepID=B6IMY5_RHOCS|nr:hypothetical protein RC1_1478 [Rhodospirillum centenum SW]